MALQFEEDNSKRMSIEDAPKSELQRLFNALDQATVELQISSDTLISHLQPVLRQEPVSASEQGQQFVASTAMSESLVSYIERVERVTSHLRDARNRSEI